MAAELFVKKNIERYKQLIGELDCFILSDLSIGVFLWISVSSLAPVGLFMSGYGSNNK